MKHLFLMLILTSVAYAQDIPKLTEDEIYKYFANSNETSEVKKSITRHFRDSKKRFYDPEKLALAELPTAKEVRGTVKYFGFIPQAYRYDVLIENEVAIIEVRIKIENAPEDLETKIKFAEDKWNKYSENFPMKFPYKFRFLLNAPNQEPHFNPRMKKNVLGPYNTFWNPEWDGHTISHEIGHMMGLADEYEEVKREALCYSYSIMCYGSRIPLSFHYYFILRRILD